MSEIKENEIVITKDDGSEETFKILFFYTNPERKKDFYFIYKDENPDELIVLCSEDGKELMECTEEEFEEANEMLETYENDPKIQEAKK
ncbi:MAG: hypothetical protein MJ239_07300 [Bacilli bacterium]|nr:hypothetical protein [Bacilli bacterium]